ncbi:MAG: hypothetical protein VX410_02730 [Actinomycetota bacterium]|nr:hypothetical protein [Actinomycetota bacterium]
MSLSLVAANCSPGDFKVVLDDTAVGFEDTGDREEPEEGFNARISGTVRVILYSTDENGDSVYKDWDVHGNRWPYGSLWVYAFNSDQETGNEDYYQNQVIMEPSPQGNDYSFEVRNTDIDSLNIGAQLDYHGDGVMATWDPIGIYADPISVNDGSDVSGIDITILAYWNPGSGGGGNSGWGWGSGASGENSDWVCPYDCEGGGNDNGTTTISGDVLITYAYAGGDAAAMIMNTDGSGPLTSHRVTPEPNDSGASAPYAITGWVGHGEKNLIGCHDSNYNLLIDAADNCGAYASEPDVDGNPISFADDQNIEGDIQIPLGDVQIDLVPFVTVHGTLASYLGDFSNHAAGSVVHVAAMKFRPSSDIALEDLVARSYDHEEWNVADLVGQTTVDYELAVPANTIIYLLAFVDEGGNNIVNEEGEGVASGSTDNNGRLATGSRSQEIDMQVQPAEWDGDTGSN